MVAALFVTYFATSLDEPAMLMPESSSLWRYA